MERGADTTPDGDGLATGQVDITAMPLRDLVNSDDSVLDRALRRLLAELDGPQEHYTAFQNAPR
jgi:FXSXX-COOH protein